MGNKIEEIEDALNAEGLLPGTEKYDERKLVLKADYCREVGGIPACPECDTYDFCSVVNLLKSLKDKRELSNE